MGIDHNVLDIRRKQAVKRVFNQGAVGYRNEGFRTTVCKRSQTGAQPGTKDEGRADDADHRSASSNAFDRASPLPAFNGTLPACFRLEVDLLSRNSKAARFE